MNSEIKTTDEEYRNEFERKKAVFNQICEQFRHLNAQMNRVPPFAVTVTGGVWYAAIVVDDYGGAMNDPSLEALARSALMIFAAFANFSLILIAIRIRDVMKGYLDRMAEYGGEEWAVVPTSLHWFRDYSMISLYAIMILAGGFLSLAAACLLWPNESYHGGFGIAFVAILFFTVFWLARRLPKWFMQKKT
ncbi:MAG: hypothetical protein AAFR11_04660 [Pseudomonadota bacterium]